MKRLNLLFVAAMVATVTLFTSCGTTTDVTTVKITLDATTVTAGSAATGKIVALGGLKSVSLLLNGSTVGLPITSFSTGSSVTGSATDGYTFRFENLAAGAYSLKAVDKNDVESTVTFTVGSAGTITELTNATTIYCTLADGSDKSTCASATGTTYAAKDATADQQKLIDFVYYNPFTNGVGSFTIYAPSAVATTLPNTFASWTTKNATTFAKTTTIAYATATYADVNTAATAATATSVSGLAAGTVVVFKTAAGKVGIFKVNSITNGYLAADYVNINIKVQN